MQDEILKLLEKRRKQLPTWVMQFELINMIKLDCDISSNSTICKALRMLREFEEIQFREVSGPNDLKKIQRNDLIEKSYNCRHITFAYRIL